MRKKKNKIPIKERSSAQEFEDQVKQYTHEDKKRANNPPVGLVTAETDHLNGKKTYVYDPHLDPQLQWAGKKEGTNFDVDVVSLHVHERIDPLTIIEN
ncbi:MAG: site-specific DNA-methyltransferase, partial [Candidatus Woesearchaeota archaeon]|nr:site-specific DNA-methyltransferase [Candidatus Woesearchaeota archaeon]